jgi:DNA-binding transcriptional LysR family regulator
LFTDEIVAIAHPKHPLAKEKYISAATLAGEALILGERGGNTRRMIDEFFNAANVRPNITMELSRQEAINQMVENDLGVGMAGAKSVAKRKRRPAGDVADRGCGDQVGTGARKAAGRALFADREGICEAVQIELCAA